MKALTLHQPHAHLIGLGVKLYETRSWPTKFRGLLAIHAAKIQKSELDGLVINEDDPKPQFIKPFDRYLPADYNDYFGNLNHGGIEALVVVRACTSAAEVHHWLSRELDNCTRVVSRLAIEDLMSFGDFSPGRFAWHLDLKLTVAGNCCGVVRGKQGLWNVPAKTEQELLEAYRKTTGHMICRVCGCTDDQACQTEDGPCHWRKDFLCSACA